MIITILQKELLSYNIPTTTDEVNLTPRVESQSKLHTEEWINTAHKNNIKLQKCPKLIRDELASTNYYVSTKNRFLPLSNLERTEGVITSKGHQTYNACKKKVRKFH
jgi:hypothetical protein